MVRVQKTSMAIKSIIRQGNSVASDAGDRGDFVLVDVVLLHLKLAWLVGVMDG